MREIDKEVLHRMYDKIKLNDMQKECIMRRINEEVTGKKRRSFNVKRFATVIASALVFVGATLVVGAKLNIGDKISDAYAKMQNLYFLDTDREVELNEEEKQIIADISVEVGYEFEVDGGKVRIEGIMYDSTYIYVLYTATAYDGKMTSAANLLKSENGEGLTLILKGKGGFSVGSSTIIEDMDGNTKGFQGCIIFKVGPSQSITDWDTGERTAFNNFALTQGDVLILTDRKYVKSGIIDSLDDIEKIYGVIELTKPIEQLIFNCENTEGMEILETVDEIRISPLSIRLLAEPNRRKVYPNNSGLLNLHKVNGEIIVTQSGYIFSVIKKDGTVAECKGIYGEYSSGSKGVYVYDQAEFVKPINLAEVDHILIKGWGLEYKIPVNVTE